MQEGRTASYSQPAKQEKDWKKEDKSDGIGMRIIKLKEALEMRAGKAQERYETEGSKKQSKGSILENEVWVIL